MPSLHTSPEKPNAIHFCTLTTIEWIDVFTKNEYFETILNSLKYCQQNKGLTLFGFVFMTNHIHLLFQVEQPYSAEIFLRDFKKWTTHELRKIVEQDNRRYIQNLLKTTIFKRNKNTFQIWQKNNYPEIIEIEKFFKQKLNYVHQNPVKKGYVEKEEEWVYSSARNWLSDDHSIIAVQTTELL